MIGSSSIGCHSPRIEVDSHEAEADIWRVANYMSRLVGLVGQGGMHRPLMCFIHVLVLYGERGISS